jgi:hypothetical protein
MSIQGEGNLFDQAEMSSFGFDPEDETDREIWLSTTPPSGTPLIKNWTKDAFEFGGTIRPPTSDIEQPECLDPDPTDPITDKLGW